MANISFLVIVFLAAMTTAIVNGGGGESPNRCKVWVLLDDNKCIFFRANLVIYFPEKIALTPLKRMVIKLFKAFIFQNKHMYA